MPYHEPDPQDPNLLVGVSLPGDDDTLRAMAETFADEFAGLGFDEERLLRLFRNPGYKAAHRAYQILGEAEIRRLIQDSVGVWGQLRVRTEEAPPPSLKPLGGTDLVQLGQRRQETTHHNGETRKEGRHG